MTHRLLLDVDVKRGFPHTIFWPRPPSSCADQFALGKTESGTYPITLAGKTINVFCDMETRESLQCNYQEHMTMTVMTLVTMTKDDLGNTRRGRVDCPPKTRGLWQTGKLFPKVEDLFISFIWNCWVLLSALRKGSKKVEQKHTQIVLGRWVLANFFLMFCTAFLVNM